MPLGVLDSRFALLQGSSGAFLALKPRRWIAGGGGLRKGRFPSTRSPSFYAPGFFFQIKDPWFTFSQTKILAPRMPPALRPLAEKGWVVGRRDSFFSSFSRTQKAIAEGALGKAVIWTECIAQGTLDGEDRNQVLARVWRSPPSLHPYGLWEEEAGFIGASPEWLFRVSKEGILTTMALAGTHPGDRDPGELLSDPKERWEHELVVDSLNQQLSSLGSVHQGKTRVCELPHLRHLKTPFRVRLKRRFSFEHLVTALHPTPALGTAPRDRWRWLESLPENRDRGHFGAPFGVRFPDGSGGCVVLIRGVHWDSNGTRLPAGCGIVGQSRASREWKEVKCKQESTRRLLGL